MLNKFNDNIHIIIIMLLLIIIFSLMQKKEPFEKVCKMGQCFECDNKVFRDEYCFNSIAKKICPDGYTLEEHTSLCKKTVTNELKDYEFTAPPEKICPDNTIILGNDCVTPAKYTFDEKPEFV
uniref:Uncharacterized protein n=1 Tax=viral metagenome TaxID=1070528 RepID=A0A6C0DAS0_9ZZZZ